MSSCEYRNIHRYRCGVGLVESDTKISLSTQQQKDENTDVHQSNPALKGKVSDEIL